MTPPPAAVMLRSMAAVATLPPVPGDRLADCVRDAMRPGVIVMAEDASVAQAQRALLAHGVHAILVLDRTGRPLGWATSTGLLDFADRDREVLRARNAVTEPALFILPSASVRKALELMRREEVTRLLVAPVGRVPEGVVAEHDLLAVIAR